MLNPSQKLVELVRILEERAYIFPGDPVQATEALRHIDGGNEEKLIRRAQIIDRDQHLKYVLQQVETGSFWLWIVAATLLFTVGFSSTYLLMDNQGLNFFSGIGRDFGHEYSHAAGVAGDFIPAFEKYALYQQSDNLVPR